MKFYRCKKCNNLIIKLNEGPCTPACCGETMDLLEPCSTDAAVEKHVPVLGEEDGKFIVCIGSVAHPMLEEHYIEWVVAEYETHFEVLRLKAGDEPKVTLSSEERPTAVYAYCNLHGLWRNE